jgi:hypothetical protein
MDIGGEEEQNWTLGYSDSLKMEVAGSSKMFVVSNLPDYMTLHSRRQ